MNRTCSVLKHRFLKTVQLLLRYLLLVAGAMLWCSNHDLAVLTRHKWTATEQNCCPRPCDDVSTSWAPIRKGGSREPNVFLPANLCLQRVYFTHVHFVIWAFYDCDKHRRSGERKGSLCSGECLACSGAVFVAKAWRVLRLRTEESAFGYEGQVRRYWMSCGGQTTRGDPPVWSLSSG